MSPKPESYEPANQGSSGQSNKTPEQVWRESFDAFERSIGRPLEAFLGSEEFADAAAAFIKANADARARFEEQADQWSRLWNMPTAQDFRDLRTTIDEISQQLSELADRVESLQTRLVGGSSPAKPSPQRSK
ncbi:MAG: hypothetical protein JO243_19250 [Solirubrobacterales bacterium]|nr:hypothetical protein [Solirubrobacterales bacterium]